jgi:hypothetical protein
MKFNKQIIRIVAVLLFSHKAASAQFYVGVQSGIAIQSDVKVLEQVMK